MFLIEVVDPVRIDFVDVHNYLSGNGLNVFQDNMVRSTPHSITQLSNIIFHLYVRVIKLKIDW
jgi:hypothetical protein